MASKDIKTERALQIKDEWVAALRSGKYKQGRHALRMNRGGVEEHCCLGVLCEVLGTTRASSGGYEAEGFGTFSLAIPSEYLSFEDVPIGKHYQSYLAGLNDRGLTFEEIADSIEQSWQ